MMKEIILQLKVYAHMYVFIVYNMWGKQDI